MTKIKICGIRSHELAWTAIAAGADYLGFVFYRPSHRYVDPEAAGAIIEACRREREPARSWQAVGVFVDESVADVREIARTARLDLVQLCGREDAAYMAALGLPAIKVVHVGPDGELPSDLKRTTRGASRLLLDAKRPGRYGGTGASYPWSAVRAVAARSFLAGGLSPGNVVEAITTARPWGVDVSSGVERQREKDPALIQRFIDEVRRADGNEA